MPIKNDIGFVFSSGAGAWSTNLILKPDGSFEGGFHDSDMGDTGEGYDRGIVYVSGFTGKFSDIHKIDDYTYTMKLQELNLDKEPGQEWIEDEIKYISWEAYGLSGGTNFVFYLPGTSVSGLPEEFVSWIWGLSEKKTMPFFGLYNVEMQNGFSGE